MEISQSTHGIEIKMIAAILQTRMSSTRLPGKVLKPLLAEPMLYRQIERIRYCTKIEQLMVATSIESEDDAIAKFCTKINIPIYRGHLNNVLDRYYQAALLCQAEHIVRLTADCPLTDPNLIDELIAFHLDGNFAYSSNTVERTYPDGLDAEIFTMQVLKTAWQESKLDLEKEHVTPFIYNNPKNFQLGHYKNNIDLSGLRWTVDYPEDFEFISKIYETLYPKKANFTTQDILSLLSENPQLEKINNFLVVTN